jgi:hypothetical protein
MGRLKSALTRTGLGALALTAALGTSYGLSQCSSASAGPLADLETLARDALRSLTSRGLTPEERGQRSAALARFAAVRTNRQALATTPLRGIYEPPGPDYWQRVLSAERSLRVRFELLHVFVGWTPRRPGTFPREQFDAIWDAGSMPLLTWEPWTDAFRESGGESEEPPLAMIARGAHDAYVDAFARDAAEFGKPMFVRFAHEMNDAFRYPWGPQRGNTPEQFRAAFRRVRKRFDAQGARNVIWVWAPSVAQPRIEEYYPGADAVDWVATGVLNYGSTTRWSAWWSVQELLSVRYPAIARYGHPLMIAEFGTVREGGDAREWYARANLSFAKEFRAVSSIVMFHHAHDSSLEHRPVDFSVTGNKELALNASALLADFANERGSADER